MKNKSITIIAFIGILISLVIIMIPIIRMNATYYYSIEEVLNNPELQSKKIRIMGAVLGDSIQINYDTGDIEFIAVHIPIDEDELEEQGGIELVLHNATLNKDLPRIKIKYQGLKPELLVNEAQVITRGVLIDNEFIADEILLKCPSKYEERIK